MQKFIKGSQADGLKPLPVVIGMSATTERFTRLVAGITTSMKHEVPVSEAEVKQSGLLKDRIILTYPEHQTTDGLHVLHAAASEWKKKCEQWYQYCAARSIPQVNPILVIQVLNSAGSEATATDMEACLSAIEERTGYQLRENEVVHTFGQAGTITVHGLANPGGILQGESLYRLGLPAGGNHDVLPPGSGRHIYCAAVGPHGAYTPAAPGGKR